MIAKLQNKRVNIMITTITTSLMSRLQSNLASEHIQVKKASILRAALLNTEGTCVNASSNVHAWSTHQGL